MAHLPTDHCGPGVPHGRPGTRPLTANFRRTGEGGEKRSRLRLSTKAWQQCGVEERWKGWRPAKSFSRTHAPHATFFFFRRASNTVWQG